MSADQSEQSQYSVLLTLDAESYSLPIVDLAVAMAVSLQARIHGLFIENEDLMRAAGFPFSNEISFPTARQRPNDVDRMQRSLRSMAGQFKKYLEQTAQASSLQWSYDYVRGRSREIDLTADTDMTYRIFAQTLYRQASGRRRPQPRRLLLLEDHSTQLLNAVRVLLNRLEPEDVEIDLLRNSQTATAPDFGLLQDVANQMQRITVVEIDSTGLLQRLQDNTISFDYVIASQHSSPEILRSVIRQVRCPVILVA